MSAPFQVSEFDVAPRPVSRLFAYAGWGAICTAIAVWFALPAQDATHRLLPLLPLAFGILLTLTGAIHRYGFRLSVLIAVSFMSARYVVMPLLVVISGSYDAVGTMQPAPEEMAQAYLLMVYEMACVFAIIAWAAPRLFGTSPERLSGSGRLIPFRSPVLIPAVVVLGCAVAVAFPSVAGNYRVFVQAVGNYDVELLSRSGGNGYLILWVEWSRLLVCLWAVNALWTAYQRKPRWGLILLSIMAFLPLFVLSNRTSRNSILFPSLAGCLLLIRLYPRVKSFFLVGLAVPLVVIVSVVSYEKNFGNQLLESGMKVGDQIPRFLQGYAAPAHGVAISIETRNSFAGQLLPVRAFVADSLANIPLAGRLFGVQNDTTTTAFNIAAYGRDLGRDQVIPMLGQGLYHWGVMAAPVYSILVTLLALWLDRLAGLERRPEFVFLYYLLLARLAAGPVLGNWTICLGVLATLWLPLHCLFALNRKLVLKRSAGRLSTPRTRTLHT